MSAMVENAEKVGNFLRMPLSPEGHQCFAITERSEKDIPRTFMTKVGQI